VFRVVIESRECGSGSGGEENGRATPAVPPTPSGSRLQARGGRSVQTSSGEFLLSSTLEVDVLTNFPEAHRPRWFR
jgi:hypothetical protein